MSNHEFSVESLLPPKLPSGERLSTRLDALLQRQRKVPSWAYEYPELFDPALLLSRILEWAIVINVVLFLVSLLLFAPNWGLALGLIPLYGISVMVAPRKQTNAFYLRAFRTDPGTYPLRRILQAGLGAEFRLSGIRPPTRRLPDFLKGLVANFTLFHYAGSQYMELEADVGWMGRLAASYGRARIAFVDLRELTEQVSREVVLTFLCLGPSRTVFVIDDTEPQEVWVQRVEDLLSISPGAHTLEFISAENNPVEIVSRVKEVTGRLPEGTAGFSETGWLYVAAKVPETDLARESRRKPGRQLLLGLALMGVLTGALNPMALFDTLFLAMGGIYLAFMALYARAFVATLGFWRIARRYDRDLASILLSKAVAGAIGLAIIVLTLLLLFGA